MTEETRQQRLDRRDVVAELLRNRGNTIVVSGLGAATYDVAACGDHERNFYLWGAMGGAAMIGLGVALAQPSAPVVVVTGDGEMLMALGAFATIALQNPANLSIVILDNELYGETGSQATHTAAGADLAAIAAGCGIHDARQIEGMAGVRALAEHIHDPREGTRVAVVKIDGALKPKVIPVRDGAYNRGRVRQALGLTID